MERCEKEIRGWEGMIEGLNDLLELGSIFETTGFGVIMPGFELWLHPLACCETFGKLFYLYEPHIYDL